MNEKNQKRLEDFNEMLEDYKNQGYTVTKEEINRSIYTNIKKDGIIVNVNYHKRDYGRGASNSSYMETYDSNRKLKNVKTVKAKLDEEIKEKEERMERQRQQKSLQQTIDKFLAHFKYPEKSYRVVNYSNHVKVSFSMNSFLNKTNYEYSEDRITIDLYQDGNSRGGINITNINENMDFQTIVNKIEKIKKDWEIAVW